MSFAIYNLIIYQYFPKEAWRYIEKIPTKNVQNFSINEDPNSKMFKEFLTFLLLYTFILILYQ